MENVLLSQDLQEQREGFKIENLEGCTWAFRKIRAIENKKTEIEAIAAAEIERINNWKEQELKQYEGDKEFFEGLLTNYYIEEKAQDKKFKLSSPYGVVTSRTTKNLSYDSELMKEYLKQNHPNLIETVEKYDKNEVKKIIKNGIDIQTGEIIDFVQEVENTNITVKVAE